MNVVFPGVIPKDLPSVTAKGRFLIPTPPIVRSLRPLHPPYLIGRFDKIVKAGVEKSLVAAWQNLMKLDVQFPKPDPSRSKTPALHLGIWELYSANPRVTEDSRNQSNQVIKAMDRFLRILNASISPKIFNILQSHYRLQLDRQLLWVSIIFSTSRFFYSKSRAYNRVMKILAKELANRPALQFGGAFFTVAAKEGSSEIIHLDFNDDPNGVSWVVPLGDWEGGEFCLPQLGIKIPIQSGQILGAMTRILAHCSAPVTKGFRIVLTLFADKNLLKHATE